MIETRYTAGQPFVVTVSCPACGEDTVERSGIGRHLEHSPACRERLLRRLEGRL